MLPLRAWLLIGTFTAAIAASGVAGWTTRDWACGAAEARRDAAAERKRRELAEFELDAWQWTIALGAGVQAQIDRRDAQRQETIRENEAEIRDRDRCRLGADGVRRLLRVSPR